MKKLIFGLGSGLVYSCGGDGKWKETLPKILLSFPNSVLISVVDMPFGAATSIYETVGKDRLYLDSGGFTLYKKQLLELPDGEFAKECERMRNKLIKMCSLIKCHSVFELDNEYFRKVDDLLSPLNYCRQDIKDITGEYPIPVFKLHQGFQYWKDLCESEVYSKLSIGGLAQTSSWGEHKDELRKMMNYARDCNKKVHLLGCQNVETFKLVRADTVDYSIFQYAINLARARKEHPELTEYKDLKIHAALYAFSSAVSRSFLYDTFNEDQDD